jgi:NAD(P)-dependent dehydrogenase (short-subunit alcohol dehydrogenase family)
MLQDRTALVTGGAGRLGRAIAAAVMREGGRVILADRDGSALAQAAAALKEKSGVAPATVQGDVSVEEDVLRLFEASGAFDILVNAHGIFPNRPILEMTVDEWDQVFAINVRGSMLTCRGAARRWTETPV